jgi:hypothetical protein
MRRITMLLPALIAFLAGASPAHAWTWPADGPVLQHFRFGDDPYAAGLHRGLDVAGPPGSSVRAPASGEVTFAGSVPSGGRTVTIRTQDGYAVTLLHLGSLATRRGAGVTEGDVVGQLGSSGTPEHSVPSVHLGIRVASEPEGYLDPLRFLPARSDAAADVEAVPVPEPVVETAPPTETPGAAAAAAPAEEPSAEEPAAGVPIAAAVGEEPPVRAPLVEANAEEPAAGIRVAETSAGKPGVADPVVEAIAERPAVTMPGAEAAAEEPAVGAPVPEATVEEPAVDTPGGEAAAQEAAVTAPVAETIVKEAAVAMPGAVAAAEEPALTPPVAEETAEEPATTAPASGATAPVAGAATPGNVVSADATTEPSSAKTGADAAVRVRSSASSSEVRVRPLDAPALPLAAAPEPTPRVLARARGETSRHARSAAGRALASTAAGGQETWPSSEVEGVRDRAAAPASEPPLEAATRVQHPEDGQDAHALNGAMAAGLAALAVALVTVLAVGWIARLRRRAAAQAQAVPQRLDTATTDSLGEREHREEARAPLVAVDEKPGPLERRREGTGVAQADVRLVAREHEVALLQPFDWMARVRRVDRERPAGDEDAPHLRQHPPERLVLQVLDDVGGDGLVERRAGEGKHGDVGDLEPQPRKERGGRLDSAWLRVHPDDVCAEGRQIVRRRAARRPEVENPVPRSRLHKITDRCKPKPRPGRLAQVRGRHIRDERVVVLGRRAADHAEPHRALTGNRA